MQLDLKTIGWGPASNPTVRRVELFADWIEAQAYLLGEGLTKPDLVDRLEGTSLTKDNDDAWALVDDAILACKTRRSQVGAAYPFAIAGQTIECVALNSTAYLFCLLVSLPEQLKTLRLGYNTTFRDTFEKLVAEALQHALPGWDVYPTGWAATADEGRGEIVGKVSEWVLAKHYDDTVFPNANDAQVDIAAVRSFRDSRSAYPVILGQCATGVTDWKQKAARPNIDRWAAAVQFSSRPTKMFAVPFALDSQSFWEATVECSGLVLDRARICSSVPNISAALTDEMVAWIAGAREALPLAA